ncbi:hypothetical protein D3C81_1436210 [compost metagenome]
MGLQQSRLAGNVQRLAIELAQQVGQVIRHQVDHLQAHRLAGSQADRFAHGLLRPIGIAPAQLRQAAYIGSGVIDLLAGEGFFIATGPGLVVLGHAWGAADLHGGGGTQVGAGGHGRDVAGIEDVSASAGSPGPAGGDEACNRHRAGEYGLDHLAHGAVQAARRIHADDHQLRALRMGLVQAAHQVVGTGRADGIVDAQHPDSTGRCLAARRQPKQHQQQQPAPPASGHLSSPR